MHDRPAAALTRSPSADPIPASAPDRQARDAEILTRLLAGQGLRAMARAMGLPYTTLYSAVQRLRARHPGIGESWPATGAPPPDAAIDTFPLSPPSPPSRSPRSIPPASHAPTATDWPRMRGDYLVISDLHIPYHDADLLAQAVEDARRIGIDRFLIVGDFLDIHQFSKFAERLGHLPRLQDDLEVAGRVLDWLLEQLPGGGCLLMGNHDARIERMVRGHMEPGWTYRRLYQADERIEIARHEQAEVESGGRVIRCLHGANYSGANPLGVAQRLAAKFESGVIMGHQHHACEGFSLSGRHQCVCMGGMHDPARLAYLHVAPRTNPAQTRSYVLLKDGYALHIADGFPDWAREA